MLRKATKVHMSNVLAIFPSLRGPPEVFLTTAGS